MGNQRSSQMWWRKEQELLSPEPRIARTSELNGSGGGRGKGIRGLKSFVPVRDTNRYKRLRGPFVPVGGTNRDKRVAFYPTTNRDKTPWPPYPLPSPPARAIQLTCSCCSWLGRERSSCSFLHHICEDLWFPVHPSSLKVWGLFFSSSLACIAHFML